MSLFESKQKNKNMKKITLMVASVTLGFTAMSQGFYGALNVGYGFSTPSQVIGTDYVVSATGAETESNIYGTYGAGINIGLTPGYMITEHFGVELGLNYFMGTNVDVNKVRTPFGESLASLHSSQFRLLPSLVVSSGGTKFSVYAKAGLVLPVFGTTFLKVEDSGVFGPGSGYTRETETKGAFSLGFNGAIGVNYGISDKLSVFGELSGMNLHINAKEREVTTATNNGVDMMSALTTYDKNISYVDELTPSSNNAGYNVNYTEDQPQEVLRTRNNFSALFINLGVKYAF